MGKVNVNEDLPTYQTKSGRVKIRKNVMGRLYGGHNSTTGIVDIAMISSLGKPENINDIVKSYGMVIMDECHHGGAQIAEAVLREVNAKYVYGMTATPKRNDGQEKKVYMQLGSVRYRFTAKDKVELQGINHLVYPRFTRLVNLGRSWNINEAYKAVISSETRNKMIEDDVTECVNNGRTPIIITKFKEHAEILKDLLINKADNVFLLQGGRSNKERESIRKRLQAVPENESLIVIAIGQYIGEGFNLPRLDTMILAIPIAWSGNVEQYAGRLHRDCEGKAEVIIYDYVDCHVRVLEKMYHKRLRTYKNIGYEICTNVCNEKQNVNSIFDSENYGKVFEKDILQANFEIIISSPGINKSKVRAFRDLIKKAQENGVKVSVITLSAEVYSESRMEITKGLINELQAGGVCVKCRKNVHEHFAVIDRGIVWYGSINLLSREKADDSLMRVISGKIAEELQRNCLK